MSNSSDDIVCNCGKKAIVLTVRKEGPNTGRQFYKCSEMAEDKRCGFFLWKDDESAQSSQMNSHQRPENNFAFRHSANANENSAVLCRCSFEARLLTVSKEGINKGRQFYACSKPREQSCGFFQWADADEIHARNIPQTQLAAGSSDRSTSQSHRRPASSNLGGPANKRKCGICKERGHNRKNCPLNR
ncbi:DNA topoisomerase 3-alpha, partial [Stegodyphus mimosarum]